MKKVLFSSLALLLLAGAGCSGSVRDKVAEKAIERSSGGKAQVDLGEGSMKVKTKDGTAEWGSNKLPADWATDAPIYPGASIQFSGSSNPTTGQPGAVAILETKDSNTQVLEYYKKELAAQGWKIVANFETGTSATIAASKGDRNIGITSATSEGKTVITVAVGKK